MVTLLTMRLTYFMCVSTSGWFDTDFHILIHFFDPPYTILVYDPIIVRFYVWRGIIFHYTIHILIVVYYVSHNIQPSIMPT
jgi:hypothetical protein